MWVKICGITQPIQGQKIAKLGASALGFICVPASPRYVTISQIQAIIAALTASVECIGVFANTTVENIVEVVKQTELTGVQLHGNESPEFGDRIRQLLPKIKLIKALRIRTTNDLQQAMSYVNVVDKLLLDAYHPQQLGGTGKTLNWQSLQQFRPNCPWLLAGGLTPDNIQQALNIIHPDGIDLSSGVEHSPGDKDLTKVAQLFDQLHRMLGEEGDREEV
ncbi:MAG: phosphoribosylanthranilate isomerase [Microcoleaceae cyanobacterium]